MNILHFCSYFISSKVYIEMFKALSLLGFNQQKVFISIRKMTDYQKNQEEHNSIMFQYVKCLSIWTRVSYAYKLIRILLATRSIKTNDKFDRVHAHTLYADGIPAYLWAMLNKIKLVITVRNTDINLGFKYYWHYKWLAKLALSYADKIVIISPAHKVKFETYFGKRFSEKIEFIPNGINAFFVEGAVNNKVIKNTNPSAIYVGAINKNKNILNAIKAFSLVNHDRKWCFTVVGGVYNSFVKCYGELDAEDRNKVFFVDKISHVELLKYYDNASLFIMPSHTETFGLVYIEALSRCLPVIYTYGQGIDGLYPEGFYGFGCHSSQVDSIAKAVNQAQIKFPFGFSVNEGNPAKLFAWQEIAKQYVKRVYL